MIKQLSTLSTFFKHLFSPTDRLIYGIELQARVDAARHRAKKRLERDRDNIDLEDDQARRYSAKGDMLKRRTTRFASEPIKLTVRRAVKPPTEDKAETLPTTTAPLELTTGRTCLYGKCNTVITRTNQKFCTKSHGNKHNYQERKR